MKSSSQQAIGRVCQPHDTAQRFGERPIIGNTAASRAANDIITGRGEPVFTGAANPAATAQNPSFLIMAVLSSFEVLAELLVPKGVPSSPGGGPLPSVPYVVQAYFVQVSLPKGGSAKAISFDLTFEETTSFAQGAGPTALLAQFIDDKGVVVNYDTKLFFNPPAGKSPGFIGQSISPGQTKIYSITALPPKPSPTAGLATVPQSGTGWRGSAIITPNASGQLIATPTQRQIYFSSPDLKTVTDSVVYAVPTASGKTLI